MKKPRMGLKSKTFEEKVSNYKKIVLCEVEKYENGLLTKLGG